MSKPEGLYEQEQVVISIGPRLEAFLTEVIIDKLGHKPSKGLYLETTELKLWIRREK